MKIYLAAPYSRQTDMKQYAAQLRAVGIEVTSRWLDETHKLNIQMHELTQQEHQAFALQDAEDVEAADALVLFTDPTKTIVRAGRHVEFGMAVTINRLIRPMPIFVVGLESENIFHHLSNVFHFKSWQDVLVLVRGVQNAGNTTANWLRAQLA